MKKLISVLAALCLLFTAAAALAEEEAPSWDAMPQVVTVDEDVELTDADFEGDWVYDKVFVDTVYLTPEEVEANGLAIHPMRIADGKVTNFFTDEQGDHEESTEYTLENNQILFEDGQGIKGVFEKLEDGNIVLTIFVPGEGDAVTNVTFFMVHPAE